MSKRGNNNAQLYGTSFVWTRFFPIKIKSDAHEIFLLLLNHGGVPTDMIMDNSKDQFGSDFRNNLHEANCHYETIKPHSPWNIDAKINDH